MISFDYETFFKTEYDKLKYMGVFLSNSMNPMKPWYKFYIVLIHIFIMGLFNCQLAISWAINSTSLINFASLGYIIMSCFMGQVKLLFLYKNKIIFGKLLKQYNESLFQPKTVDEMNIIQNDNKIYTRIKTFILRITCVTVAISLFIPIFFEDRARLPFPTWYPINIYRPWKFTLAYMHQSIALGYLSMGFMYSEFLVLQSFTFIRIQCQILCFRLRNASVVDGEETSLFRMFVQHHLLILKFLKISSNLYSWMYFAQLFSSTTTFCMCLFLITVTEVKDFNYIYLVMYLTTHASLLLGVCWVSNRMTTESENIPLAAYSCDWPDANKKFKMMLLIIILRSQKPMIFYAGNLFELSLTTCVSIMRASYSYFAVLTNLNNADA